MSLKTIVEENLRDYPQFRERKNKDDCLTDLLIKKYGLGNLVKEGWMSRSTIKSIVQDYSSMDRAWRKCLEDHPHLRGSDYDDKDKLEVKKMEELGYRGTEKVGELKATDGQMSLL